MEDKVTRQCPQTTFEAKGEPKRIRTEVSLLTSLNGSGWRKDVINQCLEFGTICEPVWPSGKALGW